MSTNNQDNSEINQTNESAGREHQSSLPQLHKKRIKTVRKFRETLKETDYIDDISQIEEDAGIDLPRIK